MKIAQEQLEEEQRQKALQKQKYLDDNVKPLPNLAGLNEAQLVAFCKDLHAQIAQAEEVKYDSEIKIRMKDYDVSSEPKEFCSQAQNDIYLTCLYS